MYGYPEKRREKDSSSAVNVIKWFCVLQIICSIIVFILSLVLFSLDFHDHKAGQVFQVQIILAVLLCLVGMGAGIAGCRMNQHEPPEHNQSRKTLTMAMSMMTVFAALFFIIFAGTISFYDADKNELKDRTKNYRGAFGMVMAIFIIGFFQLLFAVFTFIVCVIWSPNTRNKYETYRDSDGYKTYPYAVDGDRMVYERGVPKRFNNRYQATY